ncbi:MAG: Rid family hydrolase [Phycisphaerales bacterium JB037]
MPIDRTHSTGNAWEERYRYSRAVRAGDLILTTGTVSMNADGTPYTPTGPGGGRVQATRCLEIIERAVEALGGTRSDIVRTRFYVTEMDRADEYGTAHREFFMGVPHAPCLTMVEVARLIDPGFLVEIEAEAKV